jgi:hypothetical protein
LDSASLGEYLVSIVKKSYRKLLGEEENYIEGKLTEKKTA